MMKAFKDNEIQFSFVYLCFPLNFVYFVYTQIAHGWVFFNKFQHDMRYLVNIKYAQSIHLMT